MKNYFFEKAYLNSGWTNNVLISVDENGVISSIQAPMTDDHSERIKGFAIPGFPNTHSHAFQKIMAGRTEYKDGNKDNFWTWRNVMYQFANAVTPEDIKNIASFLYLEMLKAGFSSVAEFHYLHHQPGGMPYDNPAELSFAIMAAAQDVGIGLTHLSVLYMQGGFDNTPLEKKQYRFRHNVDSYLTLLDQLQGSMSPHQNLGVAFHSLRAVPEEAMREVMESINPTMPVHIHIAEQVKEVEDCLTHTGQRPVEWLMSRHDIDHRWCLVHGTHMTEAETAVLATSGAVASICTITEANLGDGFFPLERYLSRGGHIALGSDSNSLINPLEEIRWLEYGARLRTQQRNIAATLEEPHTGAALFKAVQRGGALALGQKTGAIEVGHRADFVILDNDISPFCHIPDDNILDAMIFSGGLNSVKHVMVAGVWKVKDRYHSRQEEITENYMKTIARLSISS